ncbi:lariat debranching enzyme [Sporothrix epigloea]|uniref:Lariat debranching enzyme n=1 Tax=Sporothrix epigloea TaxID=1892477 RepID=A0ABP0DEC9_9PEZI
MAALDPNEEVGRHRSASSKSQMAGSLHLHQAGSVRLAIEGCGHGALDAIYGAVDASCAQRGWPGVDLVIIGGDFQATRNAADLNLMSVPPKYRAMGDFHLYYSGARKAPYLTVFIGGNHEAAGYLWELFYGGWVAPNIYYWGAANVLRFGPLRIAGMSGIWKGMDYRQPHHERIPFRSEDTKSFYHVREVDVRKLLQIREPVDIGMSHDWPRAIEWHGDAEQLYRMKPHFRQESTEGKLGNTAAEYVLDRLRPRFWFSAHMHCKFAAIKQFSPSSVTAAGEPAVQTVQKDNFAEAPNTRIELIQSTSTAGAGNPDEIDLDMDDDQTAVQSTVAIVAAPLEAQTDHEKKDDVAAHEVAGVSSELLAQLPASFQRPLPTQTHHQHQPHQPRTRPGQPVPPTITNTQVNFLALDKCLPGRHFLQLCEIGPAANDAAAASAKAEDQLEKEATSDKGANSTLSSPRFQLEYDPEWLAITRVFAKELVIGERNTPVAPDLGEAHYRPLIDTERAWVEENIVNTGRLAIPHDFTITAPVHVPVPGQADTFAKGQPDEYTNPHTAAFCELLQVPNVWHASKEVRRARKQQGPGPSTPRHFQNGNGADSGFRGRGRGGSRGAQGGRGGHGRGRGNGGGYSGGGRGYRGSY